MGNPVLGLMSILFPHLAAAKSTGLAADERMHLLEGRRGRGKSYTLTAMTKQFIGEHKKVYTNIRSLDYYRLAVQLTMAKRFPSLYVALAWMNDNVKFIRTWDDVLESHGGVMILDEASRLFHAQRGQGLSVPPIVYEWFRQSRHFRMSIFLATQDFNWIDGKIASLVDIFWSVRKVVGADRNPTGFWLYGLDSGGAGSYRDIDRRKPDRKAYYTADKLVYPLYDTHEVVEDIQQKCSYPDMQTVGKYYERMGFVTPRQPEAVMSDALRRMSTRPQEISDIEVATTNEVLRYAS